MVIPNYECVDRMTPIHMKYSIYDDNVCTLSANQRGTCHTDSGSPVVNTNGELIGLALWGKSCALGYPDVHVAVYPYIPWIQQHMIYHAEKEFKKLAAYAEPAWL